VEKIDALAQRVANLTNPTVIDYANRIASVLDTTIKLAEESDSEDLELLVILIQDFALQRGHKLQRERVAVESEAAELIERARCP
jgi:hypothetical protein